jgi:translation initiation factor IF-2
LEKIRINDLARELEVKSKAVIDYLPTIGIDDKKSHSSSLEPDQAERVRKHFVKSGGADEKPKKAASSGEPGGIKTKIDLSKISKPGDVLSAIRKQTAEPAPAPPKAAAPAKPAAAPAPSAAKPTVVVKPSAATPPAAAPTPAGPAPKTVLPHTGVRPSYAVAPTASAQPGAAVPPKSAEIHASQEQPAPAAATPQVQVTQPPPRRVIMPQTGARPVYSAPVRPAGAPPAPMGSRPAPGRPVPGQPIFQRPRPASAGGAPGTRPPLRPGERRPMHPTRTSPTGARPGGARPMGVGPGGGPPPPGRPTARAGAPSRRPGQRYVPRGIKEGPMKGYVPHQQQQVSNEPLPITRTIEISEGISVKELAEKLEIRAKDLITRLLMRGMFATVNQTLDQELATEMARHFGADTNVISFEEQAAKDLGAEEAVEDINPTGGAPRAPVVTIMGHVDHGKTSLLDAIRTASVAEGEAGGITQHIGAYKVKVNDPNSQANGREITFIDTPGHEAFTRMRARGAKVTDIVILVVAADDGVMPQTIEAIDHAQAAKVPIIVAVNKIDKPEAMPDRVKKQLGDRGLVPEEWGGNTVFVDVSAKQKTNLNQLLEMITLTADLGNLKASSDRAAVGHVLEAKLDRGRGAVATVLIQNGTLKIGDQFIVGNTFGKVRAMFDDLGHAIDTAPPSTPVEVLGLEGLPQAGDQLSVVADRDKAKNISVYRSQKEREAVLAKKTRMTLEGLSEQIKTAGVKELPIILKGDVQGSVEVLADTLQKLSNEQVKIKVLHTGVGAITETDVLLASASNAIIIGFNVRPERKAQEVAEQEKVDIRLHSIIYELQDEIKRAMTGLLEPVFKETYLGRADVRETFRIPKVGVIAGCTVTDGSIKRDSDVRLLRDNVQVYKGKIGSLRRFKDDAKEVSNGMECGISIAGYGDIKVGDVIEAFSVMKVAAELTTA